jgi:hypothetical protein
MALRKLGTLLLDLSTIARNGSIMPLAHMLELA